VATAEDLVDGTLPVTCAPQSGSTFPLGATPVNCSATDAAGNIGSASFTVTVQDTTAPVVTAPADVTVEATGVQTATDIGMATATDAVGVVSISSDAPASYPVGTTVVTWTATDATGNAGTATQNVTILNVAPAIDEITIVPDLLEIGTDVGIDVDFSDIDTLITASTHIVDVDWGDGTVTEDVPHNGNGGSTNATATAIHTYMATGVYTVIVTVVDTVGDPDLSVVSTYEYVVVYDPDGGFVTGGGWIDSPVGAYLEDLELTGKANFGFVSKYKKGADVPTGNTEFNFKAGDMDFHSDEYDWLVVNQGGTNAQFKGSGTMNGNPSPTGELYKFMLWAGDDDPDTFRIKIWYEDDGEVVVYDNGFDQEIGGGSIVVHTK
jgi:hypothetical protein